ncbi:MAG: NADP-dependent malic enzyme [Candidatus Pacebacteria bacterium]|nr:NADP-dependent malic enzyme [Candidatus Paceibacterota bacterium]
MTKKEQEAILDAHRKVGGKIETKAKVSLKKKQDFSLFYTPGVGTVSTHLAKHPEEARVYSVKKNSVAVVSDGSAVLGLGNIGPYGALPVMEGKALIFKEKAGIDAWPLVLDLPSRKDISTEERAEEIIRVVKAIAPSFGGINLEDIKAPECFLVEERLKKELSIPVMHDDQHGTAIVVLAGLMNASKVVKKNMKKLRVAVIGAGAAGTATAKLLLLAGIEDVTVLDRQGIIFKKRKDLSPEKKSLASITNPRNIEGSLRDALTNADVVVGVSGPNLITKEDVEVMAPRAIVFALSNPVPEILPEEALSGGAFVVATGRSDFPNQINNALVFPGVFKGALSKGVRQITDESKLRAAKALASLVKNPTAKEIIPDVLHKGVVDVVAKAIR